MTSPSLPPFGEFPPTRVLNDLQSEAADLPAEAEATVEWLYAELRRLAQQVSSGRESESAGRVTELVGAAYEHLFGETPRPWFDRQQFFERAGRCMRRLVSQRARQRRQAPERRGEFEEDVAVLHERDQELEDLDRALCELERVEPRYARIIELRYYAGLTVPDVAEALGVSVSTVERDWRFARAWIMRHMRRS